MTVGSTPGTSPGRIAAGTRVVIASLPHKPTLLEMDASAGQPLSIRAKALVFEDGLSRQLLETIERIGPSVAPVLIIGETGTGKELVARHVHQLSGRRGPFLAVNCGAISEQLAESELFGHEAGAFTGATGRREGWFEAAHGGTLFLDEIGDLPLHLQVKLLRVLQEREVVRVGSRKPVAVDVRLVAATNIGLEQAVAAGRFRQDLLYRLNIAQLRIPPLRERPGDILPLAQYFLSLYSQRMKIVAPGLAPEAESALLQHAWPGNIRELENVIHFALLVCGGDRIGPDHLKVAGGWGGVAKAAVASAAAVAPVVSASPAQRIEEALAELLGREEPALFDEMERRLVTAAFARAQGNQLQTARLLGVTRNVVRTLVKRYALA